MSDYTANNKRIARNTLLLYLRMAVTMAVGLYTSRVVLRILGVSDYGVYNVVGGIITMMSFLNAAMVAASQRFFSFELGRKNEERLNKVFCTSINIHVAICATALVLGETVGLWFVNTQLNIPAERMVAANWVYQFSILTFMVNVMSVPYNSSIIAHERMSAFAYISILEATAKLTIVYLLYITPFDKLIMFSALTFCVGVIIRSTYTIYCKRHFSECHYKFMFDKQLFREMFSFAGWSFVGNLGLSFKDHISNIILNIFFGTALNAARGIGIQVSSMVNTFANNFTMALNPQITKQYAEGNYESSKTLVYAGSRYTFYLLTFASIPIIINVDYILKLWLGTVPEFTSAFLILSLITSLMYAVSRCVTTAIQATGRVKWFQMGVCMIMLSELPFAWLLLKLGYPPHAVMWPSIVSYSLAIAFRFWLLKRYVCIYDAKTYLFDVLLRCVLVFALCYICCQLLYQLFEMDLLNFILFTISCFLLIGVIVFLCGMHQEERKVITKIICSKFHDVHL